MNNPWKILLGAAMVVALVLAGCQTGQGPAEPTSQEIPAPLNRLFVPDGAVITNATLYVYVTFTYQTPGVDVHQVTSAWDENTVTWNSFAGSFDATVLTTFPGNALGWAQADVTSLVQGWVAETYPNFGLLIKQTSETPFSENIYHSSEFLADPSLRPKLEVTYQMNGSTFTVTIQRGTLGEVADAYIYQLLPAANAGDAEVLYTRILENNANKYSLLRFYLDIPGGEGCTRTPGYWKTHSSFGPAPYDATWAQIGENTTFFLSGMSYYQVINLPSSGGDAYAILGQAYIAAKLNFLAGASVPAPVQTAFDQATVLFNTYTIAQVRAWRGSQGARSQFIALAGTLDAYNNGLIGPGHCE